MMAKAWTTSKRPASLTTRYGFTTLHLIRTTARCVFTGLRLPDTQLEPNSNKASLTDVSRECFRGSIYSSLYYNCTYVTWRDISFEFFGYMFFHLTYKLNSCVVVELSKCFLGIVWLHHEFTFTILFGAIQFSFSPARANANYFVIQGEIP